MSKGDPIDVAKTKEALLKEFPGFVHRGAMLKLIEVIENRDKLLAKANNVVKRAGQVNHALRNHSTVRSRYRVQLNDTLKAFHAAQAELNGE